MAYRVLIVDDSPIIRAAIRRSIEISGIEVTTLMEAGDGVEALRLLAGQWVDIMFVDLAMPRMRGDELIEEMFQDNVLRAIPVVVVSSDRSQATLERLTQLGIREYLKKPFRPEDFREIFRRVLGWNQKEH